jgi:hypothetical protein
MFGKVAIVAILPFLPRLFRFRTSMLAHYSTTVAARSELRTFATSSGIFGHVDVGAQRPRA